MGKSKYRVTLQYFHRGWGKKTQNWLLGLPTSRVKPIKILPEL